MFFKKKTETEKYLDKIKKLNKQFDKLDKITNQLIEKNNERYNIFKK